MKQSVKFLLCGVALIGTSGCQSFWADLGLASRSASESTMAQEQRVDRLEMGRAALRAGAPGTAIYHFERAILDPATAADAYNGMGVAYARLGREDLAQRFFNTALRLRPGDTRIARNLDRLYASDIGNSPRALAAEAAVVDTFVAQAEAAAVAQGLMEDQDDGIERRGPITIDRRRLPVSRTSARELVLAPEDSDMAEPVDVQEVSRPRITIGIPGQTEASDDEGAREAIITLSSFDAFDFTEVACHSTEDQAPAAPVLAAPARVAQQEYPIRIAIR